MKARVVVLSALLTAILLPARLPAQAEVQRFVLAAGANFGGADRPSLRFAVSDAERYRQVLAELGGVNPSNAILLKEPKVSDVIQALDQLSRRVSEAVRLAGRGRTEVLFYYSGHADEKGLLLGDDRYSYQSLRDRLDQVSADVRIAVLDACASGAFTRLKGGKVTKPFLVDESASMRGHAFLTSSAENEAAQESDHIGASYFTHYLVSGLRGAADVTGDGKVTLNEAYQFAFNETLGKTAASGGGAQHPSYEINLTGTGDVVITDVRRTTATLVLGERLDGRFYIRNEKQELVVELYKPPGRRVEIGLPAGEYEVRIEKPATAVLARSKIGEGQRVELALPDFTPTKPEPIRRRGGPPSYSVAGRNRVELLVGMWRTGSENRPLPNLRAGMESTDPRVGLQYTRFLRENLAATLSFEAATSQESTVSTSSPSLFAGSRALAFIPVGLRWNPLKGDLRTKPVKPYLAAGLGPVVGAASGSSVDSSGAFAGERRTVTFGGFFGGGVDILLGRHWSLGVGAAYNLMCDFSQSIGGRRNYSGFDAGVSFGWVWGKGYSP